MKYPFLVAAREYAENARTKGFWIGLFLLPVLLAAGIKVPLLLESRGVPTRYFVLVDYSDDYGEVVDEAIARFNEREARRDADGDEGEDGQEPRLRFMRVPPPEGVDRESPESLRRDLRPYLVGDAEITVDGEPRELFAMVVIHADVERSVVSPLMARLLDAIQVAPQGADPDPDRMRQIAAAGPSGLAPFLMEALLRRQLESMQGVEYWCANLADDDLREEIELALEDEIRARRYLEKGVEKEEVERISQLQLLLRSKDPSREEGQEDVQKFDELRQFAPIAFVYLLFVGIFTVSQMLLNSTIEEKSNRIVEVLFSSITAWELIIGKLLGIAMIGFTMMAVWLVSAYGVIVLLTNLSEDDVQQLLRLVFARELMVPFVAYFTLGYLLYAGIFMAVGSMCNTIKESQNFMGPLMMISMVPLLTMTFIPKDPNGTVAVVLSWIPPWTPFVMMNRAAASPPLFDLVGTGILLLASVALAIWLSGRVFQTAILRTGQPPRLLELIRWLRR